MRHLLEPGSDQEPTFRDGVPRDGLPRQPALARIGVFRLIRRKVQEYERVNGRESLPSHLQHFPSLFLTSSIAPTPSQQGGSDEGKASGDAVSAPPPAPVAVQPRSGEKEKLGKTLWANLQRHPFMFNIADGGFTELHSLWEQEENVGDATIWSRRHDYWLLVGLSA